MDPALLASLIDEHARFPGVVAALLPMDDVDRLRARVAPQRWSLLEILVHLRDEEREDFRARAEAACAGAATLPAIDPTGWVQARRYNEQDPRAVLADLTRARQESVAWLRGLDADAVERGIEHPVHGRFRCGDFVAAWRVHDLLHLRQLATTLAQLEARRLAGWRVDYAGEIPGS